MIKHVMGLLTLVVLAVLAMNERTPEQQPEQMTTTLFRDDFEVNGMLPEAGSMKKSTDTAWWVSSGAMFIVENGVGKTIQGNLAADDPWRLRFAQNKPEVTDDGYHPQNLFRLVQRDRWLNFRQHVYFRVTRSWLSPTSYRNESNGLFLMNRYQDQNTLYYTGIRVDGSAVIKKKYHGKYHTLAYEPGIFPGAYDRERSPNLLPENTWIGVRSEVVTLENGHVEIKLYLDPGRTGNWTLAARAIDTGSPILDAGYAGIRTDFMDVEMDEYSITMLSD